MGRDGDNMWVNELFGNVCTPECFSNYFYIISAINCFIEQFIRLTLLTWLYSCFSMEDLCKGGQNQHREWKSRNPTAKRMTLNQQVMYSVKYSPCLIVKWAAFHDDQILVALKLNF